jgi:hypothetical protein
MLQDEAAERYERAFVRKKVLRVFDREQLAADCRIDRKERRRKS